MGYIRRASDVRSHRLNTEQHSEFHTRSRAKLDATRRFVVLGSDFISYRSSSSHSAKVLALRRDHDVLAEARTHLQRLYSKIESEKIVLFEKF